MVFTKPGVIRPVVIPKYAAVPVFIIKNNLRTAGISRDRYSNCSASEPDLHLFPIQRCLTSRLSLARSLLSTSPTRRILMWPLMAAARMKR